MRKERIELVPGFLNHMQKLIFQLWKLLTKGNTHRPMILNLCLRKRILLRDLKKTIRDPESNYLRSI